MGSAWEGDWKARIGDFARREGYDHIWGWLIAHPGIPPTDVAKRIGDAAAVQIERLAVDHCLGSGQMGRLVRDLLARNIRKHLPRGWAAGTDFNRAQAVVIGSGLPSPYSELAHQFGRHLLESTQPPAGWLPESGDDNVLCAAFDHALAKLDPPDRQVYEAGEVKKQPGDLYWALIEPIWRSISIYDGADTFIGQFRNVRPELGHLFATHWCQSEVRNGGFHQFFGNCTGVLAPEAAAGFGEIGMPQCAAVVRAATALFGRDYPRSQTERREVLARIAPGGPQEGDEFDTMDGEFFELIRSERGGFGRAADEYAERVSGRG